MTRILILTVALVLALAATAQAHTAISTPGPYQEWVDAAQVPTPDVQLQVVEDAGPCTYSGDPANGCTRPDSYTIWLAPPAMQRRPIFLHELGHNFDYYELDDSERNAFLGLLHRTGPWDTDLSTGPNEIFAEAYRQCARPRYLRREAPPVGLRRRGRMAAACRVIAAAA